MPPHVVSRRGVLAAGLGLSAAAVTAACGGGKSGSGSGKLTNDPEGGLGVFPGTAQPLAGVDQRITVGVVEKGKPVSGNRKVMLSFAPNVKTGRFGAPQAATFHDDGIPSKPYYAVHTRFDHPGEWVVKAEVDGRRAGNVLPTVEDPAKTPVPVPGRPMISVPSPTVADAMGVNPICTRQPACPLHQVSLDKELAQHRPLAVLFATPALCTSRTCGPVLEVLLTQAPAFADRIGFIHVEVWTDLQAQHNVPAFAAYHLTFEPILFLAGADGSVKDRLDGPFDIQECREALTKLAT